MIFNETIKPSLLHYMCTLYWLALKQGDVYWYIWKSDMIYIITPLGLISYNASKVKSKISKNKKQRHAQYPQYPTAIW